MKFYYLSIAQLLTLLNKGIQNLSVDGFIFHSKASWCDKSIRIFIYNIDIYCTQKVTARPIAELILPYTPRLVSLENPAVEIPMHYNTFLDLVYTSSHSKSMCFILGQIGFFFFSGLRKKAFESSFTEVIYSLSIQQNYITEE